MPGSARRRPRRIRIGRWEEAAFSVSVPSGPPSGRVTGGNSKRSRAPARRPRRLGFCRLIALVVLAAAEAPVVSPAATIWTGPPVTFTKADGADPTLPGNQDRMTPNVWITRGSVQGIYNAKTETAFMSFFSPTDTAWADGTAADWPSLTFTNWNTWAISHGGPPGTVGVNAVVHLVSEDIYLDLEFTSWSMGPSAGGGFSYQRSTPSATPSPSPPSLGGVTQPSPGAFRFAFTNAPGLTFSVLATTNGALPLNDWTVRGVATEAPPGSGSYQFTDSGVTTNEPRMLYRVRWP